MAIKFLSGLNLSNVTAGSILKLDSNGNIVAATAGTDYITSNLWTTTSSDIYRNSSVRIGTYQTSIAPDAKLHVFDYQTTTPKLLIEDGNTGDASMQFKISTQSYTMGIDNSDSDRFKITAGTSFGTSGIEIDSSHNIGIAGTPTSRLHLYGHGANDGEIRIDSGGDNTEFGIFRFIGDSSTYEKYLIGYNSAHTSQAHQISLKNTGGDITFYTGTAGSAAEKVRITSGGNVGIGVSAPPTDLSLGDGTHTSPDDTNRILNWYSATSGDEISNTSHYITVGQSSSDTTQPKSVGLALFNQNTANNTYSPAITFGGLSTSGNYMNGAAAIAAQLISNTNDNNFRSGELTFYTQGSTTATRGLVERMRINNYGAVLIGTTNTNSGKADFAVGSPQISWYSGQIQIGGTDMNWNAKGYVQDGIFNLAAWDGNIRLFTQGSSTATSKDIILSPQATGGTTTERVRLKGDTGNFGIGTTDPKAPLHVWTGEVSGSLQEVARLQGNWTSNPSGPLLRFTNQHNSGDNPNSGEYNLAGIAGIDDNSSWGGSLYFYTSPTGDTGGADLSTRMVIKSDGKVGIGTTNPNYKLDVNGTLRTTTLYSPIVRVSGSSDHLTLRSDVQVDQGATDPIIEFAYGTTQMGKFDQDGYMYATGFKTTTASTGLLKADGTVDTSSYLTSVAFSDITSKPTTLAGYGITDGATVGYVDTEVSGLASESYVTTQLASYTTTSSFGSNAFTSYTDHSTQGYLTSSSTDLDSRYYTETELNGFFKSITHQGNYISTANWSNDGSGSVASGWNAEGYPFSPTASFSRNGTDAENTRTVAELPNGAYGVVWRTPSNDSASDGDGGWDMDIYNVQHAKGYRSVVYFQKTDDSTSGTFYHGCHGSHTLNVNGTANSNPYFQTLGFSDLVENRWYVSVGYIQPYQYPSATDSTRSGIYDCYTGKKIKTGVDFMMKSGSTTQRHRTYQYYSTDPSSSINWWNPRFEEINGNEPSIAELIQRVGIDGELGLNFHSKFPAGALDSLTEATDATNDKILLWDESADVWKQMTLEDLQDSIDQNTTYSVATTSADGLMSSTDKTKLDGVATGADVTPSWIPASDPSYLTAVPSEYLTQNEGDARYVSFEKVDRSVPSTGGWYRLAKISRGAGRFSISYTGGNMSPHTYVIDAFKNWNNEATIAVEKFGHANYITSFRISRAEGAGNADYYLEGYFSSITNTHSFEARFQEILGYNNISEIFDVSSGSVLVASTAASGETIESLTTTTAEGLYLKNMNLDGRLNLYTDSNTTSTTALVLNGTEVEKRTLGSAAFSTATDFVAVSGDTMTGNLTISKDNPVIILNETTSSSDANQVAYISFQDNGTEEAWIGWGSSGNTDFTIRNSIGKVVLNGGGGAYVGTNRILTTADEGTGNGLDADTVDGVHAGSFLRSDATDSATGAITLSNTGNHYNGHHFFDAYDANGNHYPHYLQGSNNNGAVVNMRVYENASSYKLFEIDAKNDRVRWDGDKLATEAFVNTAVSNLVDSAPAALDTLNELAAALGDDASFSTTMSTALGNRLRIDVSDQNLTATQKSNASTNLGLGTAATSAATDFVAVSGDTMTGSLTVEGDLTVGKDGATPQVKLIYDDNHTNGDRWDTIIDIGRTQDRHSGDDQYPTYVTDNGYSISFQSNSDGVLFGMEEYSAGNYRPVIAWGDDNSDTPFNFRFNNSVKMSLAYNGVLTTAGNVVAGGNLKTTLNLDMRGQDVENATNVIYFNANNGNSANTSNDVGTGITWKPLYSGYTKRSAGIMQIGEGNYFKSGLAFYTNNASDASTDWSERMRISKEGYVGIGISQPTKPLHVDGAIEAGGKITYLKSYASLDTTGNAVAGLEEGFNGGSALFTFTCYGDTGGYQKIVYSCWNTSGTTWNVEKVIDEGTNDFDVTVDASGSTRTFTFVARSGTKAYSPRVIVEASGSSLDEQYL